MAEAGEGSHRVAGGGPRFSRSREHSTRTGAPRQRRGPCDIIGGVGDTRQGGASAQTGLKPLILRQRHQAVGARFAPFAGWEMPLQYQGIVGEHRAVRERVGVFDVSHMGRALVEGPEAAGRLRSVTTFDVTTLAVGEAHYSLYCNEMGGIDDDIFVYRPAPERYLVVHNAANAVEGFERLEAVLGGAATEITGATAMLAVQGPEAMLLLSRVLGPGVLDVGRRSCAELAWGDAQVTFGRTGYTGEDGGEIIIGSDAAGGLWDALLEGGATPAGLGARDTLRLEAALPLHGNDIGSATNPYEAGLGFAVSLGDRAAFTGRPALAALSDEPPSRRLMHMVARGRGVLRTGYAVHARGGGEPVTRLTSGSFSPSLKLGIGMAYLPSELTKIGTRLEVDVRGRLLPVEVVPRPFYRKVKHA